MHWLDSAIAAVSPGWAMRRARSRHMLNAYEAARPSRTHKGEREGRSGNEAVFAAGKSLREQARWLDENHDIVIGILDKLEERVVGARGIMVEPQPRKLSGEIDDELAREISKRWAAWSIKPEVTGRYTRPQMERMALRTWARDGEVFSQMLRGRVAGYSYLTDTPFALELLEPDFVPLQMNDRDNRIRQGIRVDAWGRPQGYNVMIDHPGDHVGYRYHTREVSADSMLHLAMTKRLHQLRGVSLLHGIIIRLADLKQYEESERVAARIAAALGFYIKKGTPDMYDGDKDDGKPREFPFAPGMTFDKLHVGEEIGMIESNRPNTHLHEFRNGQLKAVAAGCRGSYSSIARDYSGSYSSQRQELVEGFEGYAVLQDAFVGQWSRPVYRAWLEMELMSMDIKSDVDRSTLFDAVYLAPVMPWIDPIKESSAWRTKVRGGAATEAQWVRAEGNNPEEVKRQRQREIQYNRDNDLVFDSDAGMVSNAGVGHSKGTVIHDEDNDEDE